VSAIKIPSRCSDAMRALCRGATVRSLPQPESHFGHGRPSRSQERDGRVRPESVSQHDLAHTEEGNTLSSVAVGHSHSD
jgi:hypothetical protein